MLPGFFVFCELALLLERHLADFAGVGSVVCVGSQVVFYITVLVEILSAVVTVVELIVPLGVMIEDSCCVIDTVAALHYIPLVLIDIIR